MFNLIILQKKCSQVIEHDDGQETEYYFMKLSSNKRFRN